MTDALEVPFLHLDERICAVHKPPGILVHRTKISADRVFVADRVRERLGRRVWTVHRIDRATSGVLLFALDRRAAAELGRQFSRGAIVKTYQAVVRGWIDEAGTVDRALQRPGRPAQAARTRYRRLARTELPIPVPPHDTARYSLVEAAPETGRRHQIRRHFNHIAHPIIGDVNHGDRHHNRVFRARFGCHRLLLHASTISFAHPDDGARTVIDCPFPPEFGAVLAELGWGESLDDTARRGR